MFVLLCSLMYFPVFFCEVTGSGPEIYSNFFVSCYCFFDSIFNYIYMLCCSCPRVTPMFKRKCEVWTVVPEREAFTVGNKYGNSVLNSCWFLRLFTKVFPDDWCSHLYTCWICLWRYFGVMNYWAVNKVKDGGHARIRIRSPHLLHIFYRLC